MSASASIDFTISTTYTKQTALGVGYIPSKLSDTISLSTSDVSKVYTASVTSGSATVIDLTSLTDGFGAALSFSTLKACVVENTGAGSLVVGGGTNPVFGTDQYTVKSGAVLPVLSSFTVDGTHKTLTLTPSASTTFNLVLVGS